MRRLHALHLKGGDSTAQDRKQRKGLPLGTGRAWSIWAALCRTEARWELGVRALGVQPPSHVILLGPLNRASELPEDRHHRLRGRPVNPLRTQEGRASSLSSPPQPPNEVGPDLWTCSSQVAKKVWASYVFSMCHLSTPLLKFSSQRVFLVTSSLHHIP